ncbi:MAG: hypothetical protein CTY29_06530 [Methylobacter sp.]|nr:MAG: hypothetical protein CTY29_06530 [Methylobacter sp.]
MFRKSLVLPFLLLTGCVGLPTGPSVTVLPGSSVSFDQFRIDDYNCQQYALGQVGGVTASQAATNSGLTTAAATTAIGAAAGVAIGGGSGAAIGAGTGLVAGSAIGSSAANTSSFNIQSRYDTGYIQCMYAKGHRVPIYGQITNEVAKPAARPANVPPPPAGTPPPPPQ